MTARRRRWTAVSRPRRVTVTITRPGATIRASSESAASPSATCCSTGAPVRVLAPARRTRRSARARTTAAMAPSAPAASGTSMLDARDRVGATGAGATALSSVGCTHSRSMRSGGAPSGRSSSGWSSGCSPGSSSSASRPSSPPGPIAGECNDARCANHRGRDRRPDAPTRCFRRLSPVRRVPSDSVGDSHVGPMSAPMSTRRAIRSRDWIGLTADVLPTERALAWATTPDSGAVVMFLGVVRDHAEGRDGVRAMTYEAYEEPGRARDGRESSPPPARRWPDLERVALLHRVGELPLSEASVARRRVVAASRRRVRGGARSASTRSRRPSRSGSRSTGRAAPTGPSSNTPSVRRAARRGATEPV